MRKKACGERPARSMLIIHEGIFSTKTSHSAFCYGVVQVACSLLEESINPKWYNVASYTFNFIRVALVCHLNDQVVILSFIFIGLVALVCTMLCVPCILKKGIGHWWD